MTKAPTSKDDSKSKVVHADYAEVEARVLAHAADKAGGDDLLDFSDLEVVPGSRQLPRGSVSGRMAYPGPDMQTIKRDEKPTMTFPCQSCAGTGRYRGVRIHQPESKCFACGGRGWHKTDPRVRHKNKVAREAKAAAKKAAEAAQRRAAFEAEHPDLMKGLQDCSWSAFAQSMVAVVELSGTLSERQVAACYSMIHKAEEARIAKDKAKKDAPTVDISAITRLFDTVTANGAKKPQLVAYGLKITKAPESGVNAGALYVKQDNEYAGKIVNGKFLCTAVATDETVDLVNQLAADPRGFSAKAGRETGICCFCARTLTDPASIEQGVGPICADRWGVA